jgi:hypothetical protein
MAPRRMTKTPSRQKNVPEPERVVATVSPNGSVATFSSGEKNGTVPSFEQIQRRAYELFIARGGTHGCDWADWFTAEQELNPTSLASH